VILYDVGDMEIYNRKYFHNWPVMYLSVFYVKYLQLQESLARLSLLVEERSIIERGFCWSTIKGFNGCAGHIRFHKHEYLLVLDYSPD